MPSRAKRTADRALTEQEPAAFLPGRQAAGRGLPRTRAAIASGSVDAIEGPEAQFTVIDIHKRIFQAAAVDLESGDVVEARGST